MFMRIALETEARVDPELAEELLHSRQFLNTNMQALPHFFAPTSGAFFLTMTSPHSSHQFFRDSQNGMATQ